MHSSPPVLAAVTIASTTDVGRPALKITTAPATWYLQTENGGLSSLVDATGMDWLNFSNAAGATGQFRGMPNAVFPEGSYHPGFTGMTTTVTVDVWMRPDDSVAGMRWTRWTPPSNLSRLYAPSP